MDTRPRTSLISFCTVQLRTLCAAHSLATLCLFMTSGPDPGELPGFWGSMVFRHAPIPRKESGKQQQQPWSQALSYSVFGAPCSKADYGGSSPSRKFCKPMWIQRKNRFRCYFYRKRSQVGPYSYYTCSNYKYCTFRPCPHPKENSQYRFRRTVNLIQQVHMRRNSVKTSR